MNHSFQINFTTGKCTKCGRRATDHTNSAQCECCPNVGPCEVIDDMLMCASCQERDKQIKAEVTPPEPNTKEARVAELVSKLAKEIPSDRRQYFVGRITAIVDIETELADSGIDNPQYKLAEIVEANLLALKERLAAKHAEIRELQGNAVADQKYLNQIVPQLRAEEREKFKLYDINYQPAAVIKPTSTASKPRQSASDKAIASYAQMLGISVEQAKLVMEKAMKNVTGAQCTCAETPGICKVHPK